MFILRILYQYHKPEFIFYKIIMNYFLRFVAENLKKKRLEENFKNKELKSGICVLSGNRNQQFYKKFNFKINQFH